MGGGYASEGTLSSFWHFPLDITAYRSTLMYVKIETLYGEFNMNIRTTA